MRRAEEERGAEQKYKVYSIQYEGRAESRAEWRGRAALGQKYKVRSIKYKQSGVVVRLSGKAKISSYE